jgi:hypothetical protein
LITFGYCQIYLQCAIGFSEIRKSLKTSCIAVIYWNTAVLKFLYILGKTLLLYLKINIPLKMKLGCLEVQIRLRTYKDIYQTKEQAKNTFKMGNLMNKTRGDS